MTDPFTLSLSLFPKRTKGFVVCGAVKHKKTMVQVGFEPTPPKRLELESSALDHSAIEPLHDKLVIQVKLKTTTPAGFEPARAKPSRFRICLLNLSDKVPEHIL